jgi:amylosucrase
MILLLHSLIMSFGGIPLVYYGDEIGCINNNSFINDPSKASDSRWAHRPIIDWEIAARRNNPGTVEYKIFSALKRMIAVRKEIEVFADFNNRELLDVGNPHLFVFSRYSLIKPSDRVLVVANFDGKVQHLELNNMPHSSGATEGQYIDLYSGGSPDIFESSLVIPPFGFYWLSEQG